MYQGGRWRRVQRCTGGASLGAAAAPMLTSIPYVGWLAAGWAVMFGQDMGSSVGGTIANGIKGC